MSEEPTLTNSDPQNAYVEVKPPLTARDHLVDVVALEVAAGTKLATIARRHGYSYNGMAKLIEREECQQRVAYYRKRLDYEKELAQKKVLLHLGDLTDGELAVALPFQDDENVPPEVKLAALSTPASQRARQYLIDKVWPTTTKVETETTVGAGGEVAEVLVEFRDLMKRMRAEKEARTVDILSSPHVYEGEAALPNPMAARQLDAGLKDDPK